MNEKILELLEAGEIDQAESLCREHLAEEPEQPEYLFMLSQIRSRQGDLDEALGLMEQASQLDPFNPNLFHALGVLHINHREADRAREAFRLALDINPKFVAALNGMAFIELAEGNFKAAEHAADQVLAEQPENAQALAYIGTARLEQGQARQAVAYLQEALRQDPDNLNAQSQLGRAFLAVDNAAFAMQCFENALQLQPDSAELVDYLACAQLRCGHFGEAADNFRKALTLGRSNAEIFSGLAKCEIALGNQDQAEVLMRRAIEMEPDNVEFVRAFADYQLVKGNPVEAMRLLQAVSDQGNDDIQQLLARAHRMLGDPQAAIEMLEPLLARGGVLTRTRLDYVDLLTELGRQDEAEQMLAEMLAQPEPELEVRLFHAAQLVQQDRREGIDELAELANSTQLSATQRQGILMTQIQGLEQLGEYEEAVTLYRSLANSRPRIMGVLAEAPADNRALLESAEAPEVVRRWPAEAPQDERPRPAFLFSWPGSGRERLVRALFAHPDIMLVADQPETQAGRRAIIAQPSGARELTVLSETSLQLIRGRYWKDLRRGGLEPGDRLTFDSMWLSAEMLPTLLRLFPEAPMVVMSRDPRDMLLTWLKAGFVDLAAMASNWRQQWNLLERCRELFPGRFIEVDYGRLLQDPAAELKALTSALGLDWQESLAQEFDGVRIAVEVEPGEWQRYQAGLAEELQALEQPAAAQGESWKPEFLRD